MRLFLGKIDIITILETPNEIVDESFAKWMS